MANIRGFNDNNNNNNPGGPDRNPLFGANFGTVNPRTETFCGFIKNFCCPKLKIMSFIFIICIVDVIMYIISLSYKGIDDVKNGLLAPKFESLSFFGMLVLIINKDVPKAKVR
jgi:hypothetical protein